MVNNPAGTRIRADHFYHQRLEKLMLGLGRGYRSIIQGFEYICYSVLLLYVQTSSQIRSFLSEYTTRRYIDYTDRRF